MLTARELSEARADVLETLVDTGVIQRASGTVDSYGNAKQVWAASGTVACRLDPYSPWRDMRGTVAGRESTRAYLQLTLAWDADLVEGDRIVFGSDTLELVELWGIHSDRIVTRGLLAKIEGA